MDAATLLSAAQRLKPLKQGDQDSLCCLYSIINAIRLALHPEITLDHGQTRSLFVEGIHFLSHADALLDTIEAGMDPPLWLKLCRELTKHVSQTTGVQVHRTPLLSGLGRLRPHKVLNAIQGSLDRGAPVLLMLMGGYDHCSIAVGMTEHRMLLFDSGRLKWVKRANLGLYRSGVTSLHQIAPASVVSLSRR